MRTLTTLITGFLLGLAAAFTFAARAGVTTDAPVAWRQLLDEARDRIHGHYVDAVDDGRLAEAAVRGMAGSLDAHSEYLDAGQYADLRRHAAGAGEPAVQWRRLQSGYGYLRIPYFSHGTPQQVTTALDALGGASLAGLVIDLRGNPGGVLDAAAAVADDFLDGGLIVRGEGRGAAGFRIEASHGDILKGSPMVLLVDGGTASAAEILAAALKDHGRARLVGRRTWGKGTVQSVIPLSRGALRLTTARYFTPAGASIEEKGIMPDVPAASEPAPTMPAQLARDRDIDLALRVLQDMDTAAAATVRAPRLPAP